MFFLFLFFFPFKYQFISQFFLNSIYICVILLYIVWNLFCFFLTAIFYMYHHSFVSVVDFEILLSSIFLEDDCFEKI